MGRSYAGLREARDRIGSGIGEGAEAAGFALAEGARGELKKRVERSAHSSRVVCSKEQQHQRLGGERRMRTRFEHIAVSGPNEWSALGESGPFV